MCYRSFDDSPSSTERPIGILAQPSVHDLEVDCRRIVGDAIADIVLPLHGADRSTDARDYSAGGVPVLMADANTPAFGTCSTPLSVCRITYVRFTDMTVPDTSPPYAPERNRMRSPMLNG